MGPFRFPDDGRVPKDPGNMRPVWQLRPYEVFMRWVVAIAAIFAILRVIVFLTSGR